jgi:cytochrome c biogenesis protein CcmG/thiol:disulfide interchange protein DsbE
MHSTLDERQIHQRRLGVAQTVVFIIVLGVIALFAVGMVNRGAKPLEQGAAPQFTIPLFDGGTFSLAEQRGHVVVINFWASWCQPCRDEAPLLESAWVKYKDRGVVLVGVDHVDTDKEARAFIQEFGITYPNGPDIGTETSHQYRIQGVPETYFVGKDGQLHGNHIGSFASEATLAAKIEVLLSE